MDYSAGVLPITQVSSAIDVLKPFKPRNTIEEWAYRNYSPGDMHGLPVGVQVVGQRLEEEKVMEGMKIIERLLKRDGMGYEPLLK